MASIPFHLHLEAFSELQVHIWRAGQRFNLVLPGLGLMIIESKKLFPLPPTSVTPGWRRPLQGRVRQGWPYYGNLACVPHDMIPHLFSEGATLSSPEGAGSSTALLWELRGVVFPKTSFSLVPLSVMTLLQSQTLAAESEQGRVFLKLSLLHLTPSKVRLSFRSLKK